MTKEILALPAECWRWHPGHVGIMQVSTRGQVQTVDRWVTYKDGSKHFFKGQILKPWRNKWGYLLVTLSINGKKHHFQVHRLVAETWLDNPEGKPQVNHLNEQKDMNFVENLSWATAKENVNWGTRNERQAASRLNGSCSKPVEAINPSTGEVVKEFPSTKEAERKGFNNSNVSACCLGKYGRKTYKGFVWKYKDDYDRENAWTPVKIGAAKAVVAVDPSTGQVVKEFPSVREAERNGFDSGCISRCCRGKSRHHKGYIWRFKP